MKNRKFKIGDKVLFEGLPHTIVAYRKGINSCYTIKGPKGVHNGELFSVLEDGSPYKSNKQDCTYRSEEELTLIEDKMKRKFKIGDRVLYKNLEHVIVAYNSNSRNTYAVYKISGGYSYYASEEELTLIENKMEKGVVKLSLENAKELYEQGGNFRTIALSAYSEDELVFTPKDGDFIYVESKYSENSFIYIKEDGEYKTSRYISYNIRNGNLFCYGNPVVFNDEEISFIRLATEEEKQQLIEAMHKEGKDWDSVNKKIIPYRWRAEYHEEYYYIESTVTVSKDTEWGFSCDDARFNKHNYFKTEEEAQKVADKINHIFEEL